MIIKTTIRLTYNNNFIETSALKDGSQAINAINAINPFDSTGDVSADQLNPFDSTGIISAVQLNPFNGTGIVSADQATAAINPGASTDSVSTDQAIATINPVASIDSVSADQATAAINPVDSSGNVSADQLTNEGQQTFQDGTTSVYMHVDQTFDKVGLIKGYTRTITFPSAIFKPADPKNIKQIKVN